MVSKASGIDYEQYKQPNLQLKKYEPEPWFIRDKLPEKQAKTPSEWFSKLFPIHAGIYGCPFIELEEPLDDDWVRITPLSLNTDFFAAILGGDRKLGQKVVYLESECAFYYYDPRDQLYKCVSEDKLGNLLRALMMRCAEELGNEVHKLNLFHEFRSDKTIRSIVHRARSILAAEDTFFGVDSRNERREGPELYSRVAKNFVEQVLERIPGETLTLTDAYIHFCEYLRKRNMPPVKRKVFKDLVPPVVKEEYDLGIRNDIQDPEGNKWSRGWKGIGILATEMAVQEA